MDGDGDKESAHRTTISKYSFQTYAVKPVDMHIRNL